MSHSSMVCTHQSCSDFMPSACTKTVCILGHVWAECLYFLPWHDWVGVIFVQYRLSTHSGDQRGLLGKDMTSGITNLFD